ncbi:MAG TPA: DUF4232 domain-containing protein [Jatrophihabitans sp.]
MGNAAAATVAASALALGGLAVATAASASTYPSCGNRSLVVTNTPTDSGMGHSGMVLLFRNKTAQTCTLRGYPGLDAVSRSGHVLAHARRTLGGYLGGGTVRTVVVRPGHFATALAEWENFDPVTSGACRFSHAVAATPANTAHTVRLPVSVSLCRLQVHPTVAGANGFGNFAAAQIQWRRGAGVDSAHQGAFWTRARHDLRRDEGRWGYQAGELAQLIALPDSGLTPVQQHRFVHDVKDLNRFFTTPGLYL